MKVQIALVKCDNTRVKRRVNDIFYLFLDHALLLPD